MSDCGDGSIACREKQLVEIGELGATLKDDAKIPVSYLDHRPVEALAHTALATVALPRRTGLPACGLQLTPEGEVQTASGGIPQGALITAVNGISLAEHTAQMQQRQKAEGRKRHSGDTGIPVTPRTAVEALCEGGEFVNMTYVLSTNLVPTHEPKNAEWLLPENLSPDYKRDRDDFAAYRRAAELLRLVFDDITQGMPARTKYEAESDALAKRPLIQLGPAFQDADGHYQYQGEQRLKEAPYYNPAVAKVRLALYSS